MTTHQATAPCPKCGSWYRNGDECNQCREECDDPAVEDTLTYRQEGRRSEGRGWDKKRHKSTPYG